MAANCVMAQLLLRDATKSPELFEKSMKVYLNPAERACAEPVEAKSPNTTTWSRAWMWRRSKITRSNFH